METYEVTNQKDILVFIRSEYSFENINDNGNPYTVNIIEYRTADVVYEGIIPTQYLSESQTLKALIPLTHFDYNGWYILELINSRTGIKYYSKIKYGDVDNKFFMFVDDDQFTDLSFPGKLIKIEGSGSSQIELTFHKLGNTKIYVADAPNLYSNRYVLAAKAKAVDLFSPVLSQQATGNFIFVNDLKADIMMERPMEGALSIVDAGSTIIDNVTP